MTKIGTLQTKKSLEAARHEIIRWLTSIGVNGLDIDIRYDPRLNTAMLRFNYKGKEYEFILRLQADCRLNMWAIAKVMEWKVRFHIMKVEDFGQAMEGSKLRLEGKVESPAAQPKVNDINYVILGISPTASNPQIVARHRELMKTFHPDMTLSPEAKKEHERRTAEINQAYDAIKKERGI